MSPLILRLKEPEISTPADDLWEEPEALLERLGELAAGRATGVWATETGRLVRRLGPAASVAPAEATSIIRRLEELVRQVEPLSATIEDGPLAGKLRRAGHAVRRRLDIWRQVVEIDSSAPLVVEPLDSARLVRRIERYEQTGLPSDARRLANDCLYLGLSPNENRRRLAERLRTHYRNANMRLVVAGELLNRLMPEKDPELAPVRDTVVGVPVRGKSLTTTEVSMRLVPDPGRVRLALEVTGLVASLTSSTSGPATFYNNSQSIYIASKPIEVDMRGIYLGPAEVDVFNSTRLRGLKTGFDPIPLVGPLVKSVARSQHNQKRAAANREIKCKVAFKARKRIDSEADARLGELAELLRERVFGPLYALSLNPTMIDAQTTGRRFTMRLRLAGEDQLGGNTPRPRAPGNSLASFQVHESAINNVLDRLRLNGRTFTLPELSRHVAARLGRPQFWQTNPDHDDVKITFAKNDAVGIRLRDGRIALTLSVAKLSKSPRRWKNFQVRAFYRPQIDGCDVQLARDGVIHLIGRRLGARSQIALRGIFSKTFSKKHPINVTPEQLVDNPKLADLEVTQFVIDDGWIGTALGPRQTALRPRIFRR